jgi:hypothetical protein
MNFTLHGGVGQILYRLEHAFLTGQLVDPLNRAEGTVTIEKNIVKAWPVLFL